MLNDVVCDKLMLKNLHKQFRGLALAWEQLKSENCPKIADSLLHDATSFMFLYIYLNVKFTLNNS